MWEDLTSVLEGKVVRLEPLGRGHGEALFGAAQDERIWHWMPYDASASGEMFHAWLEDALAASEAGTEGTFATVDAHTGRPVGSTRYLALRPEDRVLEIGWTWLDPSFWQTGANVEAKLLMLEHAFEDLGCLRVEFKTDARNLRVRGALLGVGGRFEGIFRKHMVLPDSIRDSAWYAVLDDDWPRVKPMLEAKIARHAA